MNDLISIYFPIISEIKKSRGCERTEARFEEDEEEEKEEEETHSLELTSAIT